MTEKKDTLQQIMDNNKRSIIINERQSGERNSKNLVMIPYKIIYILNEYVSNANHTTYIYNIIHNQ